MRIGWAWLGLLAALLLAASAALGQSKQPSGKKPPPAEIVSVDMGWNESVIARDRWQPVVVWITSRDKPFSGVLTVEFPQDHTQKAQVVVGPVATTPGMTTPVEIEVAPYRDTQEIIITLTNGRFSTSAHYYRSPQSDQLLLPRIGMSQCGHIVFVGRTSAKKSVDARSTTQLDDAPTTQSDGAVQPSQDRTLSESLLWDQMIPSSVTPERLPLAWVAYESTDVVVCDASSVASAYPRAQAALSKWVESGGRLVVRVNPVGSVWPSFLSLSEMASPVSAGEQVVIDAGEEFRALFPRAVLSNAQARLLTLTREGRSRGWKTMLDASTPGNTASGSLVAYGPHGLGIITLVGIEPANVAALVDDDSIKKAWRRIIRPILPPHALLGGFRTQGYGMYDPGDTEVTGATNAALDSLAVVPPIGAGVFWLIALFMLLLTLAIGPFDAKFLKRRRLSQHSWLTAIGWISIACIGAALAPRLMRSGETYVGRLRVVDTICHEDGTPLRTASQGLTAIFAGRSIQLALEGARPGAWLRSASFVESYWSRDRLSGMPDLTIIPSTDNADLPVRSGWAESVSIPQWSFRALADSAPMLPSQSRDVGARIRRTDSTWEITLLGVPEGARVSELALRVGDRWFTRSDPPSPAPNGRDVVYVLPREGIKTGPAQLVRADVANDNWWEIQRQGLVSLPWVRERSAAIDAMVEGGRYACVYFKLSNGSSDLTPVGEPNLRQHSSSLMRLLTPLPGEDDQ